MDTLGIAVVALAMAVGLVGTFVPLLPGLIIIWAAGGAYGLWAGFDGTGWTAFGIMSLIMVVGLAASVILPQRRASARGASRKAIVAGAACGIAGFFLIPIVGLPLGAILGVLVAEYFRTGDWDLAWHITKGAIFGFGLGALAEFSAGVLMIVTWIVWVFAG